MLRACRAHQRHDRKSTDFTIHWLLNWSAGYRQPSFRLYSNETYLVILLLFRSLLHSNSIQEHSRCDHRSNMSPRGHVWKRRVTFLSSTDVAVCWLINHPLVYIWCNDTLLVQVVQMYQLYALYTLPITLHCLWEREKDSLMQSHAESCWGLNMEASKIANKVKGSLLAIETKQIWGN